MLSADEGDHDPVFPTVGEEAAGVCLDDRIQINRFFPISPSLYHNARLDGKIL